MPLSGAAHGVAVLALVENSIATEGGTAQNDAEIIHKDEQECHYVGGVSWEGCVVGWAVDYDACVGVKSSST